MPLGPPIQLALPAVFDVGDRPVTAGDGESALAHFVDMPGSLDAPATAWPTGDIPGRSTGRGDELAGISVRNVHANKNVHQFANLTLEKTRFQKQD
jgi:hypothetical protein